MASQTLENLSSSSQAVEMPILRPLLTYDKMDTVGLAQQIGTYSLSIEPYKDCCSLLQNHPSTRTIHGILSKVEKHRFPDYEEIIQKTLDDKIYVDL